MTQDPDYVLLRAYNGGERTVRLGERIAAGANGRVFRVEGQDALVVKLSHDPAGQRLGARIAALWAMGIGWTTDRGRFRVAWPYAKALRPDGGELFGYAMPRLAEPQYRELSSVFTAPSGGSFQERTWAWNLRVAAGLARTMAAVGERGAVVADLSPENIFVAETGAATLVDADGWQLRNPDTGELVPCQGSRAEITAPEHLERPGSGETRLPSSDWWALAVVIATVLFAGTHPFGGVLAGEPGHWEEPDHVRQRMCWLFDSKLRVPPGTPPLKVLPGELYRLFESCFYYGYERPELRPAPQRWAEKLEAALEELRQCDAEPLHLYPRKASACPWCGAAGGGRRQKRMRKRIYRVEFAASPVAAPA